MDINSISELTRSSSPTVRRWLRDGDLLSMKISDVEKLFKRYNKKTPKFNISKIKTYKQYFFTLNEFIKLININKKTFHKNISKKIKAYKVIGKVLIPWHEVNKYSKLKGKILFKDWIHSKISIYDRGTVRDKIIELRNQYGQDLIEEKSKRYKCLDCNTEMTFRDIKKKPIYECLDCRCIMSFSKKPVSCIKCNSRRVRRKYKQTYYIWWDKVVSRKSISLKKRKPLTKPIRKKINYNKNICIWCYSTNLELIYKEITVHLKSFPH